MHMFANFCVFPETEDASVTCGGVKSSGLGAANQETLPTANLMPGGRNTLQALTADSANGEHVQRVLTTDSSDSQRALPSLTTDSSDSQCALPALTRDALDSQTLPQEPTNLCDVDQSQTATDSNEKGDYCVNSNDTLILGRKGCTA